MDEYCDTIYGCSIYETEIEMTIREIYENIIITSGGVQYEH